MIFSSFILSYPAQFDVHRYIVMRADRRGRIRSVPGLDIVDITPGALNRLLQDGTYTYAFADIPVTIFDVPSRDEYSLAGQDFLDFHAVPQAWEALDELGIVPGKGVRVAVVDTGIFFAHPEWNLADVFQIIAAPFILGGVTVGSPQIDQHFHGTWVASIIAAPKNKRPPVGIAYSAEIASVGFLPCGSGTVSDAVIALDQAILSGAHIINNSWGFINTSNEPYRPILDIFRAAIDRGIFITVAAGNSNTTSDVVQPASLCRRLSGAMSVGSVARNKSKSYFSNYGGLAEIGALGEEIFGLDLGQKTTTASGTSASAPIVAGIAALGLTLKKMPPAELENALIQSGEDINVPFHNKKLVNAKGLIDLLLRQDQNMGGQL
ncbi:MAG: S8 family serine peptidase [Archaeoglobaceae archaeon]